MPPPPDEIVIDTDISFSLEQPALDPSVGSGAPPPAPAGEGTSLDSIFDGIDIAAPAPSPMSDPALDAGDFLPHAPPPVPGGDGVDWGGSAAPSSGDLGQDLVAAFNAASTESLPAPGPAPLDTRLRALAERLRAEGRSDDADILTEAILSLGGDILP